jgi:uncharacterized membrane protein
LIWHCFKNHSHERKTEGKGWLEAFSDGVIAILITIMVLELKIPHSAGALETPAGGSSIRPSKPPNMHTFPL